MSSDRKKGKLPILPSEPTTTSVLHLSLGHLLLVTMTFPYSKQLLQLVLDSVDVQQLSRAESASLLVLFSAREAMMQEVPPNITLFLCAAWRRLGNRNELPQYICSSMGSIVVSEPCFLFVPAPAKFQS